MNFCWMEANGTKHQIEFGMAIDAARGRSHVLDCDIICTPDALIRRHISSSCARILQDVPLAAQPLLAVARNPHAATRGFGLASAIRNSADLDFGALLNSE